MFLAGNYPPSKQVNGFWYHSFQGHQLLKLAMGEEALSANCTVRTASGTFCLKYNRWGDTKQRFVPHTGRPMGRKASMEINKYSRDQARKTCIETSEVYPIERNPSPPRNWRATGLRESNRRRKLYNPQVEPISDEEESRAPSHFLSRDRRREVLLKGMESRATHGHWSHSKRGRTPSPGKGYRKRQGDRGVRFLYPLRRAETETSLNLASREKPDSEDTDSVPE